MNFLVSVRNLIIFFLVISVELITFNSTNTGIFYTMIAKCSIYILTAAKDNLTIFGEIG
jgi:hypothetical protein